MTISLDVAIVGGGMIGAAIAQALCQQTSLTIAVVDAADPSLPDALQTSGEGVDEQAVIDSRVVALNRASMEWLHTIDAASAIASERQNAYQKMTVWDAEGTGSVNFDCADLHRESLGTIVENAALTAGLWATLEGSRPFQRFFQDEVIAYQKPANASGETVLTLKSGLELATKLVIAADGPGSKLRELSGLPYSQKSYAHSALVATVEVERPHENTAWQCFSASGPLAFLPLPSRQGRHYCATVWSQTSGQATTLHALNNEDFAGALARHLEHRLGRVLAVHHRRVFELTERHAQEYVDGGLVLVGDAAHTIHPLAGQGANLGLADAKALTEEIIRAITRELEIHHPSVLARYRRRRRAHNTATVAAMAGFKTLFEQQNPALALLRNKGMEMFNRTPWLKRKVAEFAAG